MNRKVSKIAAIIFAVSSLSGVVTHSNVYADNDASIKKPSSNKGPSNMKKISEKEFREKIDRMKSFPLLNGTLLCESIISSVTVKLNKENKVILLSDRPKSFFIDNPYLKNRNESVVLNGELDQEALKNWCKKSIDTYLLDLCKKFEERFLPFGPAKAFRQDYRDLQNNNRLDEVVNYYSQKLYKVVEPQLKKELKKRQKNSKK